MGPKPNKQAELIPSEVAEVVEIHHPAAIIPQPPTPLSVLHEAVQRGANIDTLTKLLELQERFEANEARKAFVSALAAFKANPPKLEKSKDVAYKEVKYKYTPLDEAASIIGKALAAHDLSFRWETGQAEGRISVTCILQHKQGHSERVTLEGQADNSGSKNSIQAIGSTVTYLERYTLFAITGLASANQDTDGTTMADAADYLTLIAESRTIDELKKNYTEAVADGLKKQSAGAVGLYMKARQKREQELRA